MKVLYLIVSHTNPDQVIRLVNTIKQQSAEAQVVIHHDFAKSELDRTALSHLTDIHILEDYVSVQWGEFSMVEMELHCIDWILTHAIEFDWLVLISGQDYPIKPLSEIEHFLATTDYDGFMEYFLAEDPPANPPPHGLHWSKQTGIGRFFYHYHWKLTLPRLLTSVLYRLAQMINGRQPWINLLAGRKRASKRGRAVIGIRCFNTPFTAEFKCYAGSQWYTLSDACVRYISEFVQQNPNYVAHYRHTLIPDESFFQTILLNQPKFKIFNNNQRYISWDSQSATILMTSKQFEELIQSGQHFARKFDSSVDNIILDLLDQHLSKQNQSVTNLL
jgi:hypothetical protein